MKEGNCFHSKNLKSFLAKVQSEEGHVKGHLEQCLQCKEIMEKHFQEEKIFQQLIPNILPTRENKETFYREIMEMTKSLNLRPPIKFSWKLRELSEKIIRLFIN